MSEQPDMIGAPGAEEAESLVGHDFSEVPETKWAPQLANAVKVLEAMHLRQGREADEALELACDAVLALAQYQGGRVIYWPRGDRLKIALRDARIHSRWQRGVSIEQLAGYYGLTDIHVYRIVSQQRELHLRKTQGRLFSNQ